MSENLNTAIAAVEPSATAVYALGRDAAESARLQRQSDELRPDSIALLNRVGIGPGRSAIDLGCGPSGIIELLDVDFEYPDQRLALQLACRARLLG